MSLLDPLRVSSLHFSGVTPTKSESDWPSPLAIQRSLWDNSDILTFKVFSYLIYFFKTINLITQQNKASQIGRPLFLLQMRGSPLGGASNAEIGENKAR